MASGPGATKVREPCAVFDTALGEPFHVTSLTEDGAMTSTFVVWLTSPF